MAKRKCIGDPEGGCAHYGGMGFRGMPTFNLAMLGKQCWRLLTEPNSSCARVLKGRYFPNEDFLNASKPRSASYTWRSILKGKKLLQLGLFWRVRDGSKSVLISERQLDSEHTFWVSCYYC
jgi:hypothetical protein